MIFTQNTRLYLLKTSGYIYNKDDNFTKIDFIDFTLI